MQLNLDRQFGIKCNKKRVYRVMKAIGMKSVIRKKKRKYKKVKPDYIAENILDRKFTANTINEKWLTDITEFKYGRGEKLYLSAILDLRDKSIVSYKVSRHNNVPLVNDTFNEVFSRYPDAKPLIHSDRGIQYTSTVFKDLLDKQGITRSMSRIGRCIDNGPMEAFWGTIKTEMYYLQSFPTYESLKIAIDDYIQFYNLRRYQIKLGGLAPLEYRALHLP